MKNRHFTFFLLFLIIAFSCNEKKVEQVPTQNLEAQFDSMFTKPNVDSSILNEEDYEDENLTYIDNEKTDPFKEEDSIIGIGVISINDESDNVYKKLNVYDENNKLILKIQLNDSQVVTTYFGKKITNYEKEDPINTRLFIPSTYYFGLAFDCIDTTKDFYKVVLDRRKNTIGYIKKAEKAFKFETIDDYVKGWISLGFDINRQKNPVREQPDEKSKIIENVDVKKHNYWNIIHYQTELKGDWVKVKLEKDKFGWTRWRKGNKILIKMYFAC